MRIAQLITTSLAIICSVVAARAQTLTARHLSETHTQVRVDAKDRFLLLPVQETAPEARVRVLSDLQEV